MNYGSKVKTNKNISMHYKGTIKGALDNLSMQAGYDYAIHDKQVHWAEFITKTFDISFMPGSSTYMVGQSGGGTSSASSRGDVTSIKGNLDDKQYSSLQGNISVWNDLKQTLNNLKSKEGTVDVSEATTTVTVNDHVANVRAIADYIKQLNAEMSRQVELQVKVLQIDLNQAHQYGIDWGIVQKWLGTEFTLTSDTFKNVSTVSPGQVASPASFGIGNPNGVETVLKAIGEQGKLSVVTEPSVVTMNNNVAEIRISRDTAYLEKLEQTITGQADAVSTSVDPGIVTDGLTLYLLPKIQGNKIYLQVSSMLSTLQSIDTINSKGDKNKPEDGLVGKDVGTTIQVPTLAEKRFNIRSIIKNHATLIIGGFKQLSDITKKSQLFGSSMLGGKGSSRDNVETIILITPTIIENEE